MSLVKLDLPNKLFHFNLNWLNHLKLTVFISIIGSTCLSMADESRWQFSLDLGYSLASVVAIVGNGTQAGLGYTPTYSLDYSGVVAGGISFQKWPKNDRGYFMGLTYEPTRTYSSGNFNTATMTIENGQIGSTTQILDGYIGVGYRWNICYIPIGLAVGGWTFQPATGSNLNGVSVTGVDAYVGLGWRFFEHLSLEVSDRILFATSSFKTSSASENDVFEISDLVLALKVLF